MRWFRAASFAALALGASAAFAQAPAPSARESACRASALSLCREPALAHDRVGVRACLIRNFDKVSPDCQAAMKAVQARESTGKPDEAPPPAPAPRP
jgi:hypothetical protein